MGLIYLPTFTKEINVGKYTSPMEPMGNYKTSFSSGNVPSFFAIQTPETRETPPEIRNVMTCQLETPHPTFEGFFGWMNLVLKNFGCSNYVSP